MRGQVFFYQQAEPYRARRVYVYIGSRHHFSNAGSAEEFDLLTGWQVLQSRIASDTASPLNMLVIHFTVTGAEVRYMQAQCNRYTGYF
jgi:hypothetical protein